jgi:putative Mg2+ transporter-C (MgtC) family protein
VNFQFPEPLETISKLSLSLVLSGLIGIERESKERPAGFRTHVLVGVGSCLVMMISYSIAGGGKNFDPGRLAAQVISGIGFLGAGTILRHGDVVRGLTTAASLWTVAAIGLAVGAGWYVGAAMTSVLVFLTLWLFRQMEWRWLHKGQKGALECLFTQNVQLSQVLTAINNTGARVTGIEFDGDDEEQRRARITVNLPRSTTREAIAAQIRGIVGVEWVGWL